MDQSTGSTFQQTGGSGSTGNPQEIPTNPLQPQATNGLQPGTTVNDGSATALLGKKLTVPLKVESAQGPVVAAASTSTPKPVQNHTKTIYTYGSIITLIVAFMAALTYGMFRQK